MEILCLMLPEKIFVQYNMYSHIMTGMFVALVLQMVQLYPEFNAVNYFEGIFYISQLALQKEQLRWYQDKQSLGNRTP